MKKGTIIRCKKEINLYDSTQASKMREELIKFNREIGFVWALCGRRDPPPIMVVSMPKNGAGLLLDNKCKDFVLWIKDITDSGRLSNSLSGRLVRVLWGGEIIVTFAKWIEEINQKNED